VRCRSAHEIRRTQHVVGRRRVEIGLFRCVEEARAACERDAVGRCRREVSAGGGGARACGRADSAGETAAAAGHPGRRASKLAGRGSACRTRSPPGRLNPAGFGAADCASLTQPALHYKRMAVCPIPDHERKASGCGWGAGCCAGGACGGYRGPGLGCPPGLEAWGARDHSARGFSLSVRVADGHRLWPLGRSAKKEHFLLCCRGLAVRPSGGPFIRQNERTQRPVDRDLHADRRRRHDRLGAQRHPTNHSVPPPGGG
jgi:hypothetical protein